MSIDAILAASAALENGDAGLAALGFRHAFDEPPETIDQSLPCSVRYQEGMPKLCASRSMGRYNLHNFKIEVHFPRGVLQTAYNNVQPILEAFQTLYAANLSIGGTCDVSGFREPACDGPYILKYAEKQPETLGYIFYMWAKEIYDGITVDL